MKKNLLAILRTLVFVLPLSFCFVSCEGFDLEEIFGNIIKPSGDDEDESEEYDKDLILRELSEMEVGFICDPNYAEGADSYLFTNGLAMSVSSDSVSGYFVLIDSLDLAEAVWTESKRISIHLDSLYRPTLAVCAGYKMLFEYNSDESISVMSYAADGTPKEISLSYRQQTATRASAQPSGLDGLSNGLDILGMAQDALGNNGFGHVNFLANLFSKALPEGLPQDFASLLLAGIPMTPRVAAFLAQQFGYVAGGPLGWAALIATGLKTVQDFCIWLVKQKIGDCTPRITSATVEGKNSVDVRVEFSGEGFSSVHDDTPMFCIQYWQEVDGRRVRTYCTDDKEAKYGFTIETISGLVGGKYGFQVILYPSSFYRWRSLLNFDSNVMYAEISPLYLSEVTQDEVSYYNDLLTFTMKAVTEYQSEEDRVVLSYFSDYGVYVQNGNQAKEFYSYKDNGSHDYYINFDFKKSDMNMDSGVEFKATPKVSIKFGVYTKDGYGIMNYYDEQIPDMAYTDSPEACTGESSSVSETEATVKCEYEDCLFWNVLCGVEYSSDTKTESILLDATKEDGEYDFHLDCLTPNTTYKYRAYYEVNGVREYGETKSFKTKGADHCNDANHVHAVDLGLSVKWACCNVGADVPEGYGGYYAWGETMPKSDYSSSTSVTYGLSLSELKSRGIIGSDGNLTAEYDAATANWGSAWRMPTQDEQDELRNHCSWIWTTQNGVKGYKVTGPNGNSIFLPAAGSRRDTSLRNAGSVGTCWSATPWGNSRDAYFLSFWSGIYQWDFYYRSDGRTVRPVSE